MLPTYLVSADPSTRNACAKDVLVVVLKRPVGSLRSAPATAWTSPVSSITWRQRCSASAPASVRLTRRVVRCEWIAFIQAWCEFMTAHGCVTSLTGRHRPASAFEAGWPLSPLPA